jgi:hypothetical protein
MALRSITIRIGYTWDDILDKDERWKALREFCTSAGLQGLKLANSRLSRAVTSDDEDERVPNDLEAAWKQDTLPTLQVERLRATAGRFAWENIRSRIDSADVLVFDFTPVSKGGKDVAVTSGNVWLELGYAYGKKDSDNVFVTHADEKGFGDMPSDLRGLIVGHLPKEAKMGDRSLRSAIAGAVKRIALERVEARAEAEALARASEAPGPERLQSPATKQLRKKAPTTISRKSQR